MNSRFVFDAPGRDFTENIPLGNGILGAMISGDPERERITLNHSGLWSGYAHDAVNPAARDSIARIREAYFAGRYAEADETAQKCLLRALPYLDAEGSDTPFGAFLPLGELEIFCDRMNMRHPESFRRCLDIDSGICTVQYRWRDMTFDKEYFTSFADSVFAMRIRADRPGKVTAAVRLRRMTDSRCTVLPGGLLRLDGTVSGGNSFCAFARVRASGGTTEKLQDGILVSGANELEILLSASTSIVSGSPETDAELALKQAEQYGFSDLLARHEAAFRTENGNFRLDIGPEPENAESVSTFFTSLENGTFPGFCSARFLAFSRYLLLSSSRPGNLPATIQGIWNDQYRPPWNCDYHLNGNTQIIYWPAEACGLSRNHLPLLEWIRTLAVSGAEVARKAFGARGWCAAWVSNPFGYAAPGQTIEWGYFPEAGAWICMHIRDHFEYTLDMDFLRSFLPILQGACAFCLDMLAPDPETGRLLFGPTIAPEHGFIAPDGKRRFIVWGTTAAQECVWELFRFTLKAGALLGSSDPLQTEIRNAFDRLALPSIDAEGMIGKWIRPHQPDGARHLRHMMGLYPGVRLAGERTEEITAALTKTLEDHETHARRTYWGAGSWSGSWLVNLWARMKRGEKAAQSQMLLMRKTLCPNLLALNSDIFQQDGHSGCVSGILEMLVQERDGRIELLPALPDEWPDGSLRGLHVRGGFELDLVWAGGKPHSVSIRSEKGGTCSVAAGEDVRELRLGAGERNA